ncbi:MAG: ATP-binding cassette domain-containing protein [Sedimentisphaeraceae bacterium JB056]
MEIDIQKRVMPRIKLTPNIRSMMRIFSLTTDDLKRPLIDLSVSFDLKPGEIYFITGPSGCGKSLLLREMRRAIPSDERIDINDLPLSAVTTMIDCFKSAPLGLRALSRMGLSDVSAMLLPPAILSEGQKYRYRLAKAISSGKQIIIADEFCSTLDKVTAGLLCLKLRRIADRTGKIFILAGHSRGLLPDLMPDCVLQVHSNSEIIKLKRIDQTDMYERA